MDLLITTVFSNPSSQAGLLLILFLSYGTSLVHGWTEQLMALFGIKIISLQLDKQGKLLELVVHAVVVFAEMRFHPHNHPMNGFPIIVK